MNPRPFSPKSFIRSDTEAVLDKLPGHPWDVVEAADFLRALGASDKMLVNRWIYRAADNTPPFEPQSKWAVGSGAPRVIRKDRAMAWARSGGEAIPARECWPYAAKALEEMGWRDLDEPEGVQEVLNLLFHHDIIRLATPLRAREDRDQLYL